MTTVDTAYVSSRLLYIAAGWSPIPIHGKAGTPAPGFTGREGAWVSETTSFDGLLVGDYPNVALRLPENVVGIDVDAYVRGEIRKTGDITLKVLEGLLGALPPTFVSTARELPSGIRLFRLPDGVVLGSTAEAAVRAKAGDHVDIIRSDHRFARCWPSPKPEMGEGVVYRWLGPSGKEIGAGFVPDVDMLPMLSEAWVDFLTTPPVGKTDRVFTRSEVGRDRASEAIEGDRLFADDEEALHFLLAHRELCLNTPEGSGFNAALNGYAHALSAFVPEFFSLDEAWELAEGVCAHHWGSANYADRATITSGLEKSRPPFYARRPTETEAVDPFRAFANPVEIWEKQGRKVGTKGKAGGVRASGTATEFQDRVGVGDGAGVAEDSETFLSEAFWAARPVYAHLRRVAWSAMESPEGVFTAALALTIARVMPNVMLPAPVGVEASLNLMTVIAGDPADGKSVCRKLAERALKFEGDVDDVWRFNPSSGQGIAGQFQTLRKERGQPAEMVRTRYRAIANVEESDTLQALAASPTSTLSSELRKSAMGEDLGFGNVGETQTNLKEHTYRLVLMMCLQPELGAWLLGDAQGGLPQRFLWCSVRDPRVVSGEEMPGVWPVVLPTQARIDPLTGTPRPRFVMSCTNALRDEIRAAKIERKLRGREAGVDFDGHAILTRFKVAGGLALMDGRLGINDEDWALAGAVMTMSNASRAIVQEAVAGASKRDNEKKAKGRGASRVIEEGVVADVHREQVAQSVLRWLDRVGATGMTKSELRKKIHLDRRHLLDEGVLDGLRDAGLIRFEDILKDDQQVGSRWFRVT